MYKQTTEYKSIQKKLVTAVAMVLVACIMVVSTSYAWFTLSTAPEVTGITTSVGANGNLEMALRTGKLLDDIETTIGATYPTANNSWGNLVDLSDASYMLSAVALQPARLNITLDTEKSKYSDETSYTVKSDTINPKWVKDAVYEPDGAKITRVSYTAYDASDKALQEGTTEGVSYYMYEITTAYRSLIQPAYKLASKAYLQTPIYDINGQPQGLDAANVINGTYNPSANGFVEAALNNTFGVRAVGTSSQMSPAEMALRAAKQTVSSTITSAKTEAATSLRVDSVELASIIINQYVSTTPTFSQADVTTIETAIANLQSIAAELESALDAAVKAVGVAQNIAVSGKITVDGDKITATGDGKTVSWTGLETLETALVEAYNVVSGMTTTLDSASNGLPTGETVTWEQISAAMSSLMTTTDIRVIDSKSGAEYTVEALKALPLMNAASILMGTPTISIVDGVYADVASLTGNFSASTSMTVNVEYNGIDLKDTPVDIVMATAVAESTVVGTSGFYLPMILSQLSSVSVSGTEGEENTAQTVITDIYGYVIDLAFRTNAAGSSLLLQTDAVDRVDESYGDDSLTKGHGSYMEFKSGHPDFTLKQVAALMGSVRVVFLNDEGNIFGVAALDVSDELVDVLGEDNLPVTYDPTLHGFYRTETVNGEEVKYAQQLKAGTIEFKGDAPYVRAELALYGFEVSDEGILKKGDKLSSDVITTLDQNIAKAVSTLVYLDGDTVENKDVAISGDSMTGSMNLQFASSAELDPMDYTFTNDKLAAPKVEFKDGKLVITNVDKAASYQITYGTVLDYTVNATAGETTEINVSEIVGTNNNVPENISLMIQVVANPDAGSQLKASNKTNVQIIYTKPVQP
ncbi:MAG: hypothetical protein IKC38_06015 [Clostridia bacterium]|nr:hypothetical protein [Clostridia bacterium]